MIHCIHERHRCDSWYARHTINSTQLVGASTQLHFTSLLLDGWHWQFTRRHVHSDWATQAGIEPHRQHTASTAHSASRTQRRIDCSKSAHSLIATQALHTAHNHTGCHTQYITTQVVHTQWMATQAQWLTTHTANRRTKYSRNVCNTSEKDFECCDRELRR